MDNKENNFEHIINNQPEESMMIQNIEETPEQLQESVAESSSTFSNETSFNEENTNYMNSINTLNNMGANSPDIRKQLKESNKNMKFIIIAAVFLFAVIVGVSSIAVKKTYFDKAPNDIKIPDEDPSHKIETEDEAEQKDPESETPDEPATPDQEEQTGKETEESTDKPSEESQETSTVTPGSKPTNYKSIKDAVERSDNFKEDYIQGVGATTEEPYNFKFHMVSSQQYIISIKENSVVIEENKINLNPITGETTEEKTEKFKAIQSDIPYIPGSAQVPISPFEIDGAVSGKYLVIKITKDNRVGKLYILDNHFRIKHSDYYDEQSTPAIGENKVYYGKHNCKGKRSNNSTGPVVEIYELDTKTGEEQYKYNIDSQNKLNICQ